MNKHYALVNANVKEYLLSTDEYDKPKVLHAEQAIALLVLRLLIMIPGTNPIYPDMGVGIGTKYRYMTEDEYNTIVKKRAQEQLATYLPEYQDTEMYFSIEEKILKVEIYRNSVAYIYHIDLDNPINLETIKNR